MEVGPGDRTGSWWRPGKRRCGYHHRHRKDRCGRRVPFPCRPTRTCRRRRPPATEAWEGEADTDTEPDGAASTQPTHLPSPLPSRRLVVSSAPATATFPQDTTDDAEADQPPSARASSASSTHDRNDSSSSSSDAPRTPTDVPRWRLEIEALPRRPGSNPMKKTLSHESSGGGGHVRRLSAAGCSR